MNISTAVDSISLDDARLALTSYCQSLNLFASITDANGFKTLERIQDNWDNHVELVYRLLKAVVVHKESQIVHPPLFRLETYNATKTPKEQIALFGDDDDE